MASLSMADCVASRLECIYTVVAPKTIRSGNTYRVAITVHNANGPCEITVSLNGPSLNEMQSVEVLPKATVEVTFDVPKLSRGDYQLKVASAGGLVFSDSTKLLFADDKTWIYIQTDKATYKPSDTVQFRVLFLNKYTTPAKLDKPASIEIHDGEANLIKRWKDVSPIGGLYSGELRLSDQPVLGNWTLAVEVPGEAKESKVLVVDKYVVPKFEVSVITAKDVAASDGDIKATIRARYTFRKPVKGSLVVSIEGSGTEQRLPIDGQVNVQFPITASSKSPLKIVATVTEELTDLKHNGSAYVTLHQHRHSLHDISWPTNYIPGIGYTFSTAVKNLDGSPVRGTSKKVRFDVLCCQKGKSFEAVVEGGIATQTIQFPHFSCMSCLVTAKTDNAVDIKQYVYKLDQSLKIEVITKNPKLGTPLKINVVSTSHFPYFTLTIVGRGNIIANQYMVVPRGATSYEVQVDPTFDMVPQATLYVHYVVDGVLRSDKATVDFEKDFGNTIEISAPKEAKPAEKVNLRIKTDPHSFVGLLGVDQSVLLLRSGNDLNRNQILDNLDSYSTDLVTLTNANIHTDTKLPGCYTNPGNQTCSGIPSYQSAGQGASTSETNSPPPPIERPSGPVSTPQVRKRFPETWLFSNITDVGANGECTLSKVIPDTMTSWVITGFSLNSDSGLAVTRNPTKVRVFQPFFVTTNLPYSVKRNEVIAIPVLVFNYLGEPVRATVSMDNSDREYEFVEATNANVTKGLMQLRREKILWIPANTSRSTSFMIRPKKVGLTTLKITAISNMAGDTLHEILRVEANGVTKYGNKAMLVSVQRLNRRSVGVPEKSLIFEIDEEIVPDSMEVTFDISGSVQAPELENLDNLVRMPSGCGEQNMINFVPNILVLRYLKARKLNRADISDPAKTHLETGYQRELTYKHNDGSYSAFGTRDAAGSTWLTAYVIRSFHQASEFIGIDSNVLKAGLDFLESRQRASGEFPELGQVIHNSHGSPLALTSFVLLAFYENQQHISRYRNVIDKAVQFVVAQVDQSTDAYDLSIAALALKLAKHSKGDAVLAKLEGMANRKGDHKWWSSSNSASNRVEVTSYVLLALLEQNFVDPPMPIVDWLISQRNSNGGFHSSQDTVVGLMALTKFELQTNIQIKDMQILMSYLNNQKQRIQVTPEHTTKVVSHSLPRNVREVKFSASGQGRVQTQLQYRYNVETKEPSPSFKLTVSAKRAAKKRLALDICGEYTPVEAADRGKPTNMALMQIVLPSGYESDPESFASIKAIPHVKRVDSIKGDVEVHVYFDFLEPGVRKCLTLKAIHAHAVALLKPAYVRLYDYYAKERIATEYYTVDSSPCDICYGNECGEGCL
ncbi:CD109 antigen [Drosophila ficusphila]|uniref:CD109 antigen n=1 Tax=Drosophila ficusphila TaxID=30025 RepID=UPI001C895A75|nr:CD109 antigen [Drosophila ficusphila]